jgi:ERCC4-type nuclease
MSEGLRICVDSNEASARRDILNYLRLSGFEVEVRRLDVCDYGVSVLPTEGPDSTSVLLHRLAYREQAKEERTVQLRSLDRSMPLDRQQVFLLSGLPQIGTTLAEELLRRFDTPLRVLEELGSAEVVVSRSGKTRRLEGPLAEVRGVGPVIVEGARRLLRESYGGLCDLE